MLKVHRMGHTSRHIPVKLIIGIIYSDHVSAKTTQHILTRKFGKIDREFGPINFSCTQYYEKEIGKNLKRKFFSFQKLISLKKNYKIKLLTSNIERKLSKKKLRTVNIDPGYVSLTQLVLFTTKHRSHRIYLDGGISADLELQFSDDSFRPIDWAYPDYKTVEYIDFFNSVRKKYVTQIKGYFSKE